ncbi:hypothetical protein TSUD_145830 [Trifolium subterraneum]|uniref:Uncharacterized protein n=1 Tax=Trifolium subterraneum TaxID=3900 RepID=A0A2Z6N068_TRISU|nr:hypothetical protein TSUD_145830 [Trifolium subterraneum]
MNEINKIIEIKVATLLLVNQAPATLGFFEVGVNLVLFLTRVLGQYNAEAANNDFYNLLVDAGSDLMTIAASKLGLLKEISMKPVLQVSYIHQIRSSTPGGEDDIDTLLNGVIKNLKIIL